NLTVLRLLLRLNDDAAHKQALAAVTDAKRPEGERLKLLEALGQVGRPDAKPVLLQVLTEAANDAQRGAALAALQGYAAAEITETVLMLYPKWSPAVRGKAQTYLASRPASALALLQAVEAGKIAAKEIPIDQLRRMLLHKDAKLEKLMEKDWGKIAPATAGEKQTRISNLRTV